MWVACGSGQCISLFRQRFISKRKYCGLSASLWPEGLFYYTQFLDPNMHNQLIAQSFDLHRKLVTLSNTDQNVPLEIGIPQPQYVKSAKHNLPTTEFYQPLEVSDSSRQLKCEFFRKYGEEGHSLTYFRGNHNIPLFARESVIPLIAERVQPVAQLLDEKIATKSLNWKMTFNTYGVSPDKQQMAGFPFHMDLPSNGRITMILSLMRGAELQIIHKDFVAYNEDIESGQEDKCVKISLEPASLLVLSGASRWDWRHRVLPSTIEADAKLEPNHIGRISVVLGCQ